MLTWSLQSLLLPLFGVHSQHPPPARCRERCVVDNEGVPSARAVLLSLTVRPYMHPKPRSFCGLLSSTFDFPDSLAATLPFATKSHSSFIETGKQRRARGPGWPRVTESTGQLRAGASGLRGFGLTVLTPGLPFCGLWFRSPGKSWRSTRLKVGRSSQHPNTLPARPESPRQAPAPTGDSPTRCPMCASGRLPSWARLRVQVRCFYRSSLCPGPIPSPGTEGR